jgi:hypothetical protein
VTNKHIHSASNYCVQTRGSLLFTLSGTIKSEVGTLLGSAVGSTLLMLSLSLGENRIDMRVVESFFRHALEEEIDGCGVGDI